MGKHMKPNNKKSQKQKDNEVKEELKRNNVLHLQPEIEVRAQLGGICRQTFYTLVKSGRFPGPTILIGSKRLWNSTIAPDWIRAQQQQVPGLD